MGVGNKLANGLNARQQKFVASVLEGKNGTAAAVAAGYSPNGANVTAAKLVKQPNVAAVLKAGQLAVQEAAQITAVKMIEQLSEDRDFARQNRNPMAAVKASELVAKVSGLLIDKVESKSLGVVVNVTRFSDDG
jgi:phage terminase small subunit